MVPVFRSLVLLLLKAMHNRHGNYLQTHKTTTLFAANFMCGRLASAVESAKYFIFLKTITLILQKLMTGNINDAYFRHLSNT